MRERERGRTQEQAAASANVSSRKTVAKYERLGRLPSEVSQPTTIPNARRPVRGGLADGRDDAGERTESGR